MATPVVTPTPTCVSPSILQADGKCKNPDGTTSCPSGQTQDANGNCNVACVSPKILENGVCVSRTPEIQITSNSLSIGGLVSSYKTISINRNTSWSITGTIPSWLNISKTSGDAGIFSINLTALQANTTSGVANPDRSASFNVTGTGATPQTLKVTQVGRELCSGFEGPTRIIFKYLDKTNPNPISENKENYSLAVVMMKGCGENGSTYQNIVDKINTFEISDTNSVSPFFTLSFSSNSIDSNFTFLPNNGTDLTFLSKRKDGTRAKNSDVVSFDFGILFASGGVLQPPFNSCKSSNCFFLINNNSFTISGPGRSLGSLNLLSTFTPENLNDPTKFDPSIKTEVNRMYTNFADSTGVTWKTILNWQSVLIP